MLRIGNIGCDEYLNMYRQQVQAMRTLLIPY